MVDDGNLDMGQAVFPLSMGLEVDPEEEENEFDHPEVKGLKGHTVAVTSVACHPGGDQIASASYDKTIIIWDAKTGKFRRLRGTRAT